MRINVRNGLYSTPRSMPGGAPHGTKSGNFLFCIATRDIDATQDWTAANNGVRTDRSTTSTIATTSSLGLTDIASRVSSPATSPVGGHTDMRNKGKSVCYIDDTSEEGSTVRPWQDHVAPPRWVDWPVKSVKFVDDVTGRCCNDVTAAISYLTTSKERKSVWADGAQAFYQGIVNEAGLKGMRVNPKKTKMVCISAAINSEVTSFIEVDGERVESQNTLKIVGYTFGKRPGQQAHLDNVGRRVAQRSWIVRNLKKAGVPSGKLVQVYCAMIRPLLEYVSPAFHTCADQSEMLERLQKSVMKTIFGFQTPYKECLRVAGIQELKTRRETMFDDFTKKAYASPIWRDHWFTPKPPSTYALRAENIVIQHFAGKQ